MRIDGDKLKIISEYYALAVNAAADAQSEFALYRAQYNGDNAIDGSNERALFVRNVTYELIETLVSTVIPSARVKAGVYSTENDRRARTIERLCDKLRDRIDFERINDVTERDTTVTGAAVYLLEWDSRVKSQRGISGDVCISAVDPCDFFPQPDRFRVQDMDYCFIRSRTTKRDVEERYGVSPYVTAGLDMSDNGAGGDGDTVEVVTCYYYGDDGRIAKFVFSGDTVLEDISNYYSRKRRICRNCRAVEEECRCKSPKMILVDDEPETVRAEKIANAGGEVNDDAAEIKIPWYVPRSLPVVIRTNITSSGRWYGQSDCKFIRPYQQEINKLESRIHSKIMNSTVIPVLPSDSELRIDNSINSRVLRLREGETRDQYGVIDTTVDVSQELENAERIYEMAKRAMGITESFQGQADDTAISGKAKQIQVEQAAGRMASKRVMKQVAFAEMDRIIFELYLAYADEARPLSYVDSFGRVQNDSFNRYSFIKRDPVSGEYYYDDNFLFSTDDLNELETERKRLAEESVEYFKNGLFGDQSQWSSILRFWQSLERLKHPLGRFNVEYFQRCISEAGGSETVHGKVCDSASSAAECNNIIDGKGERTYEEE